jgi:hypothetical protein
MAGLVTFDWDSRLMVSLDWGLTAVSFAVWVLTLDPLWLAGTAVGALASWYRPMGRIQALMLSHVRRRA